MENFSKRATSIIFLCFLLLAIGWSLGWQKVAESSYPPTHFDYHFPATNGAPAGKAASAGTGARAYSGLRTTRSDAVSGSNA